MAFFQLQEGEKIVWESGPLPHFRTLLFVKRFIGILFFFLIIGVGLFGFFLTILNFLFSNTLNTSFWWLMAFISIFIFSFVVSYITAGLVYSKEYYWVTNIRIIKKMGFIGYHVNSIPLERISDVIISRSFLENIFGIASLHIQSLAGQYSTASGSGFGAEGKFSAVADPEGLQKKIFELIKTHRKEEKLSF